MLRRTTRMTPRKLSLAEKMSCRLGVVTIRDRTNYNFILLYFASQTILRVFGAPAPMPFLGVSSL
jgi:hypothetical protein